MFVCLFACLFVLIFFQAQFLREKTTFPSPFQWFLYLASFVHLCKAGRKMEREQILAEQSSKRKKYLQLLKKLLDIKLHIEEGAP